MRTLGFTVAGLILASFALPAQMMPGMGNGSNGMTLDPQGDYTQMFQSAAGMGAMGSGMGVGMTEDLALDADGTAYVVRAVASQPGTTGSQTSSWQYELAAISPADGSVKWKLRIPGGRLSHPTLAPDGRIFLTVDNYQMFYANYRSGGQMMTGSDAAANDGQLLIITHTDSGASVQATIQTNSDVLAAPRIVAGPSASGYFVYVLGYDMMSWTTSTGSGLRNVMPDGSASFAPGNKVLYAYQPDGTLKFSVQLGQTGMMP